jgi:hypothetical protein
MNVDEIYTLVKNNTQGGKLKLQSSTVVGGAQKALDTFFGGSLELAGVTLTKEGDRVVARGSGLGRPFENLDVNAAFFDLDGRLAAEMSAKLKSEWSFGRSFPPVSGSILDQVVASDGALVLSGARGGTGSIGGSVTAGYKKGASTVALGTGFFKARTDNQYIAGFVVPGSPGSMWDALSALFSLLEFSDSGIIYSTFDASRDDFAALTSPSVPGTVPKGVTFYTTVGLGNALSVLGFLLGTSTKLHLRGLVDLANPANSNFQASIPGDINLEVLRFKEMVLAMRPGATEFSIASKAVLSIAGASVELAGGGSFNVAARTAKVNIIVPRWERALGIPRLTIAEFGLAIGITAGPPSMEFMGRFEIGGARKVGFKLGGKMIGRPVALMFELEKPPATNPLKLSDIIEAFTSLDLGSVPLLKDIAFRDLAFYAIADPSGQWTAPPSKTGEPGQVYKNGIGLRADLRVFDWDMSGKIEVDEKKGIKAEGKIDKAISLLGVLRICAASNRDIGPSFKIDTTRFAGKMALQGAVSETTPRLLAADDAYFAFDGAIELLGLRQAFKGSARPNGFDADFSVSLASLFTANFHCEYEKGQSFKGSASGGFDLRMDLPALKIGGVTIIPATRINGPTASLALGVTVNSREASLAVGLKFAWLGADFDISFKLDAMKIANVLSNLWDEIQKWIVDNLKEFYKAILSTAEKFIEAIKKGALWVADQAKEIAAALKAAYNYTAEQVSKALKEIGCAIEDIVKAVSDAFNVVYDEAARIVNSAVKTCAVGMAGGFIKN